MKEFDRVFKDMDKMFKDTERIFKQVDSDMDRVFNDMDRIMKQATEAMKTAGEVARKQEIGPWEEWFAWHPVKVNKKKVWLKKVYRRCINTYIDHDDWKRYQYGTIFDAIKDAK